MDSQKIQKLCRLQKRLSSLGALSTCFVFVLLLSSCATELKDESAIEEAPEEFQQSIEFFPVKLVAPEEAQTKPKADDSKSTAKSKSKAASTHAKKNSVKKGKATTKKPVAKVASKSSAASKKKSTSKAQVSKIDKPAAELPPSRSRAWPYGIGEQMKMTLRWGVIEGGVVTLKVDELQQLNGEKVIHYAGTVKSSKMLNMFYRIDNTIDTWVRLSDLLPLRQEIKQLESSRWGRRVMVFDHKKDEVKLFEHMEFKDKNPKTVRKVDKISDGAQDLFGAFYFYRWVQDLQEGFLYPIHDKSKNWNAELRYIGKESMRVPAGVFDTRHYKILPKLEGQLKPKGDIDVWVTDDDRSVLVQFKAKIKVGSLTGELIEYTEGRPIDLPLPRWTTPARALGDSKTP